MIKHSQINIYPLLMAAVLLFSLAMRLPAVLIIHKESDEIIYRTLAKRVSINPQQYNLQDTGLIKQLPKAVYDYPVFHHPPLFVYLLALIRVLWGEWAQILLPITAAVLTIGLTYLIGRRMYSSEVGLAAAVVLACCPVFLAVSTKIWMETTLTFLMTLAFYIFIKACDKKNIFWFIGAGIVWGLSLLTKHFAVALLPVVACYLWQQRFSCREITLYLILFILPAVLVNLPWLYFYYSLTGQLFYVNRFTDMTEAISMFKFTNYAFSRPPGYYFTLFSIFPIYVFAVLGIIRHVLKRENLALVAWALIFFVGLSVLGGGALAYIIRYLTPALPAFALLSGGCFIWLLEDRSQVKSMRLKTVLCYVSIVALSVGLLTGMVNTYMYKLADVFPLDYFWQVFK